MPGIVCVAFVVQMSGLEPDAIIMQSMFWDLLQVSAVLHSSASKQNLAGAVFDATARHCLVTAPPASR